MKNLNKTFKYMNLAAALPFVAILLGCSFWACTSEIEEYFVQDGSIRLTSKISSTSRVTDQSLQSTQIVEGQQVGVTITEAESAHENVAWLVGKNGSLTNTGANVYWGATDVIITAYHPYCADWTGSNHTFSVNTDQSTDEGYLNSDLLWAKTTASPTNNPVALKFTHKLSKINVTLINDGNEDMSNATITICGTNISTGFNPDTGELYAVTESIADIKASVTTESAYTASAIIVPQTMEQGTKFIKITLGDKDYHYTLPEEQVFESGQAYGFTIKVNISDNSNAKTDYVDMKFDMPGVSTSYNEADGSLTMTYPAGSIPNVKEGNAIVLPAEYGFDIRVIESVTISGNTLSIKTSKGTMANLFRNTSFTLTTDAEVASRSANSNVYTPVAYGYVDENGTYHEVFNESRAVYPIENFKWEFKKDYNGKKIYEGKAGTLSWDKCEFTAGLKGTFTFDFGEKTIDEVRAVGDLKRIDYKLTGNVDMDMLLHYYYKYEYEESGDEIIEYNAIPMMHMTFRPIIAGVPVPIHLQIYTHLGKMFACQIEGELDATAGVKMGNEVTVGLEWTAEGGAKPIQEVKPYFEFYPLTVKAQASAEAKVSYYPQWEIGIYSFKAIWLEPRPYLKEKVEAGFRASTDGENYIGWKAETYNGMDIRMGLETEFGFWRKDVWTSKIYNCVKDRLLFEAPSRITTLSPKNNVKVEEGESVTAEFMVESFSPVTNKYYPCPWALINFEPECGELDKPLAVTDLEGKATVNWTPTPSPDTAVESRSENTVERTLTAKVVDKEGESIDEATLIINSEGEDGNDGEDENEKMREALIKLYQSTNGDDWTNNENWCSNKPITEWYGVFRDEENQYTLSLNENNLTGKIEQTFPEGVNIRLTVDNNELTAIDISGCSSLERLDCNRNPLESLNVSGCTSLRGLEFQAYHNNDVRTLSYLNASGCTSLEELYCDNNKLTTLLVDDCTSLKELNCSDNPLEVLDASGCTSLEMLTCGEHKLTTLLVDGCTSLKMLMCNDNQLTVLDASGCTSLESLFCDNNKLTTLLVDGCTSLKELICNNNQLSVLDVSSCTSPLYLNCENNQFTTLDFSRHISLWRLDCNGNPLESLNVSGCTSLRELQIQAYDNNDVKTLSYLNASGCTSLEILICGNNKLTTLLVDGCTSLKRLDCNDNQLSVLDVSSCTSPLYLNCENNQFTSLDFSGHISLESLICNGNSLESLNVSGCISLRGLDLHAYENNDALSYLNASGCTSLEVLYCDNQKLTNLLVDGCTSLKDLDCNDNQLSVLDVSGCTSLEILDCANNKLTSLHVDACTSLKGLNCENNQFTTLDFSGHTSLESLECGANPLESLNVSGCTSLVMLFAPRHCNVNTLSYLNVSGCTSLEGLGCENNRLTTLLVDGCTSLKLLYCDNNQLTSLDVSGCTSLEELNCDNNKFTTLDVSGSTSLKTLSCYNKQLISLDISRCTSLEELSYWNGQLTSLNVSGCTSLKTLSCNNNQLTSLDVSGCTSLEVLDCDNNKFTTLDVSGSTSLKGLSCNNNRLTSLDVSGCTSLEGLDCENNQILSVIPGWFSQLKNFSYDVRYRYYEEYIDGKWVDMYEDRGIGWWYPGEPAKGKHSPD